MAVAVGRMDCNYHLLGLLDQSIRLVLGCLQRGCSYRSGQTLDEYDRLVGWLVQELLGC